MFLPGKKHTSTHLRELEDEVHQLHPILNALLKKLPDIERVYYNQGNSELGADFILFRRDRALLRTTCIGVVVKADTIRQNTSDVERQIKECFVSRKTADGTEIQIREVWVISSRDITVNARDVLNKSYADKKIEFIPGEDLAALIDEYAPDSFVTTSPALQEFAENMLASLAAEDQRSLIVPGVEGFYVEPKVIRRVFDGYGKPRSSTKISGLLELLKLVRESQLSIVQATAGGGKSRLARELVKLVLSSSQYSDGEVLPSIEHSKDFVDDTNQRLAHKLEDLRTSSKSEGTGLLFLDGFDEIDFDESESRNYISRLAAAACELRLNIVLFSRPFDEAGVLGGQAQSFDIYRIEPLRGRRAIDFLGKVAGQLDVKSKIVSDLNGSPLIRALDGAPIAYLLLGRLLAENRQDIPSNLTELFQKYTELVLGRWEISKGLRSQQEYEILIEALTWLSEYMLSNQLAEVARSEFEQWIRAYCRERSIIIDSEKLVTRACGRNSILYFRSDVDVVGYRHRAFSEFFYARHLNLRGEISLEPSVFSPYWVNSYYFLAGIKRDCEDLLRSLLDIALESENDRFMRAFNFGNFLLAGYMTPSTVAKDAVLKIACEIADMFISASDPRSESALTQLPTLQVLGLLTSIYAKQYGYTHFLPALEEAIYDAEGRELSERNAVALFLMNAAYREAGGQLRFDDLIEKFGDSLSVVVKLGIHHETDKMKLVSDRVKKMKRNLRRAFSSGGGGKEFLNKLYNVPVRQLQSRLL